MTGETLPEQNPSWYEQLVDEGIREATRERRPIDHATARRVAILLSSQFEQSALAAEVLARFADTGAISRDLKDYVRSHSRSGRPGRPLASKLMEYCIARGGERGPIGANFGAVCDQLDQAEAMLAEAKERAKSGIVPARAWPEVACSPAPVAIARQDADSELVTLVLDPVTANIAMYAIRAYADQCAAHGREIERVRDALPPGSYGRSNREAIMARQERVASRLRTVLCAYDVDVQACVSPPEVEQA